MASNEEVSYLDLLIVRENLKLAKIEDDVDLKYYLDSFQELNKFFTLLGTIFGFVSSELDGKMTLLRKCLEKPDEKHFSTVKEMINYEKDNNLLAKSGYVSGSRTLLRLNRALEFMQAFLKSITELKDEDSTSAVCIQAYNETLSKHHSFLIRTGAKIAMRTLPVKHELLHRVCGNEENIKKATEILTETLEICSEIYDRVHEIYNEHDLLTLP